ncbi:hypothetical protein [Clostridium polynesiense]|uniref:hypothetical protein n=1 Tax=Clostridium polynesiense TaxID=1325933 RepID=UPI00058F2BB1|nr:hypothetical protein [Clostridium polynesiense]
MINIKLDATCEHEECIDYSWEEQQLIIRTVEIDLFLRLNNKQLQRIYDNLTNLGFKPTMKEEK